MTMWDPDGPGSREPALVVGGPFTTAGGIPANYIALWDGFAWSNLGAGMNAEVNSLAVLSTGDLVAGGAFTSAGGVPANYIAKWNGKVWSPLGTGMNNTVNAVAVLQNGDLAAGGFFNTAGGVTVNRIARWNGGAWFGFGTGMNGIVWYLQVRTNGDLVAAGEFTTAGGSLVNRIARWNGASWLGMGGANSWVVSLGLMSNGDVVAGGLFTLIGGTPASRVARWNGTNWSAFGSGMLGAVWDFASLENGDLIAGGQFVSPASYIARWDGSAWNAMGSGMDAGVLALLIRTDGELLAGGEFTVAGGVSTSCLAHWGPAIPILLQQPQTTSACSSGVAAFTVTATGTGPLICQWQAELDSGIWTDLFDGDLVHNGIVLGTVTGSVTASLQIGSLRHFLEDRQLLGLRCVVRDDCAIAISNPAPLFVWPTGSGDANDDGVKDGVDIGPFSAFVVGGSSPGAGYCACDITDDGFVDVNDVPWFVNGLLGI